MSHQLEQLRSKQTAASVLIGTIVFALFAIGFSVYFLQYLVGAFLEDRGMALWVFVAGVVGSALEAAYTILLSRNIKELENDDT